VVNHYSMWLDHLLSTASFHHVTQFFFRESVPRSHNLSSQIQHASSSSRRPSISSMISTSSNSLVEKASSPIKSLVVSRFFSFFFAPHQDNRKTDCESEAQLNHHKRQGSRELTEARPAHFLALSRPGYAQEEESPEGRCCSR